jgi:hypothetical protein
MGKLVLRKTILRNMIDRVWAALGFCVYKHAAGMVWIGKDQLARCCVGPFGRGSKHRQPGLYVAQRLRGSAGYPGLQTVANCGCCVGALLASHFVSSRDRLHQRSHYGQTQPETEFSLSACASLSFASYFETEKKTARKKPLCRK